MGKKRMAAPKVPLDEAQQQAVEEMIRSRVEEGRLPCGAAHAIAKALGVPVMAVGQVAEELRIKISQCQLGCF